MTSEEMVVIIRAKENLYRFAVEEFEENTMLARDFMLKHNAILALMDELGIEPTDPEYK